MIASKVFNPVAENMSDNASDESTIAESAIARYVMPELIPCNFRRNINMATYECEKCEMSVNATCGKCDAPLVNASIETPGGDVQVSQCPNGHGKIKSPMCCGQDMNYAA